MRQGSGPCCQTRAARPVPGRQGTPRPPAPGRRRRKPLHPRFPYPGQKTPCRNGCRIPSPQATRSRGKAKSFLRHPPPPCRHQSGAPAQTAPHSSSGCGTDRAPARKAHQRRAAFLRAPEPTRAQKPRFPSEMRSDRRHLPLSWAFWTRILYFSGFFFFYLLTKLFSSAIITSSFVRMCPGGEIGRRTSFRC